MIMLSYRGYVIGCDEVQDVPAGWSACSEHIVIPLRSAAGMTTEEAIDNARQSGWRAYAHPRRRDLCPKHRAAARRRLTLIRVNREDTHA